MRADILQKIVQATQRRVEREKLSPLKGRASSRAPFCFEENLRKPGMAFICEVKRASPSKGVIAQHFPYRQIAQEYEDCGAAAISVLTEPDFFMGSDDYLAEISAAVKTPLLRKDFVIDEFQIRQAASLGADAVLLIVSLLSPVQLQQFITAVEQEGMTALVEARDEEELHRALDSGARVVGVNNRDLRTFAVDLTTSICLRRLVPSDVVFVAESGISTAQDVALLKEHGVDAVLVGESLMRAGDKRAALASLRGSS